MKRGLIKNNESGNIIIQKDGCYEQFYYVELYFRVVIHTWNLDYCRIIFRKSPMRNFTKIQRSDFYL